MVSKNPFIETLPPVIMDKLHRVKPPEESVLIQVATDMADERSFGEQWLVVTGKRLLVIPSDGEDGTVEVPIHDVKTVKAEELVGGGRLELERKVGGLSTLHYSRSLAPKFAEVAEGFDSYPRGGPFPADGGGSKQVLKMWKPASGKGRDMSGLCEEAGYLYANPGLYDGL